MAPKKIMKPSGSGTSTRRRKKAEESGGLGNVDANLKQHEARNKRAEFVKLDDGDTVIARVIDVDSAFKDGFIHPVPHKGRKGSTYYKDTMCMDQKDEGKPCPGCRDELEKRYKFWTRVIVRGDEDAKDAEEREDCIKILSGGPMMIKQLNKKHKRHGLQNRDIEITREGKKLETTYEIEWYDDEDVPLTEEDVELIENDKTDLMRYAGIPKSEEEFFGLEEDDDDDDEDVAERTRKRGSGFGERRSKKGSSRRSVKDDDDEDDEPPVRRQRRSTAKGSTAKKSVGLPGASKKTTIKKRR